MRSGAAIVFVLGLVGCGDNLASSTDDDTVCEPEPGELPETGNYIDPYAIDLPADCVVGGLRDLPGRWFLRAEDSFFNFSYPRFAGSCTTGFRNELGEADDHDDSDDYQQTYYTWSDGTRFFQRRRIVYGFGGQTYEYINADVSCMRPDGTLAATYVRYYNDGEPSETLYHGVGERFAPKDEVASNMEYVGELGGTTGDSWIGGLNLIVEDNVVYMVGIFGFDTIDVSNPAEPVLLGHIDGYLNDVRVVHGNGHTVAFAASERGDDKVWIIDVTDPSHPDFISVINEYAHSLQVRTVGDTTELFLANYSATVPRYDVTDPLAPEKTGVASLPGQTISGVHDLTVYGDKLYVNNTEAGFVAVDTSANYTLPVELGRRLSAYSHASWAGQINGREIVLHGDEGMNMKLEDGAAFMRIMDGDPQSPTYLQDLATYRTRKQVGIHNIEVHGTRAYISYYQDGIRIVDLADPTNPVEVAHYNTWDPETSPGDAFEGAVGVRKAGDYVYVADLERGLIVLREL
jgi:hypothetical protein